MPLTATAIKREANALRDPERAAFLQRYFRTGPGDYGEGDRVASASVSGTGPRCNDCAHPAGQQCML